MRCDISFPKKFDKLNFTIKLGTLDGYVQVKNILNLQSSKSTKNVTSWETNSIWRIKSNYLLCWHSFCNNYFHVYKKLQYFPYLHAACKFYLCQGATVHLSTIFYQYLFKMYALISALITKEKTRCISLLVLIRWLQMNCSWRTSMRQWRR